MTEHFSALTAKRQWSNDFKILISVFAIWNPIPSQTANQEWRYRNMSLEFIEPTMIWENDVNRMTEAEMRGRSFFSYAFYTSILSIMSVLPKLELYFCWSQAAYSFLMQYILRNNTHRLLTQLHTSSSILIVYFSGKWVSR